MTNQRLILHRLSDAVSDPSSIESAPKILPAPVHKSFWNSPLDPNNFSDPNALSHIRIPPIVTSPLAQSDPLTSETRVSDAIRLPSSSEDEATSSSIGCEPSPYSPHVPLNVVPGRPTGNGVVDLSGKGLKSIQPNMLKELHSDFSSLQVLRLCENLLLATPFPAIGLLGSLRVLDLSHNELTCLNASLSQCCPYLEELILDNNELISLPDNLSELPNLRNLSCSDNLLEEIPAGIGAFGKLKTLKINNNKINCLPFSLGNLQSLQKMDFSNNLFSWVPSSLHQLTHLTSLTLDWFRYCAPSLPRCAEDPAKTIDKFRYEHLSLVASLSNQRCLLPPRQSKCSRSRRTCHDTGFEFSRIRSPR